jgi:hypothetical protein
MQKPNLDWFASKLKTGPLPDVEDFKSKYKDVDVVINVSDEYRPSVHQFLHENNKVSFWFPMGEATKDMGLSSIYAAMQILYNCYLSDATALVHCHAGANRSRTIHDCFYYLIVGSHYAYGSTPKEPKVNWGDLKNIYTGGKNRLLHNCQFQHLPRQKQMEAFLEACGVVFGDPQKFDGYGYDYALVQANIYSI